MEPLAVVILAAGLGKRMGGDAPKVLAETRRMTLIEHAFGCAATLNPERIVVVTGHKRELVEEKVSACAARIGYPTTSVRFAVQAEQLGTGHAVKCALPELEGFSGCVILTYGDVPLVKPTTLTQLVELHQRERATLTLITLKGDCRNAYGRVVRDGDGRVERVVELRDCSSKERLIDETNSGLYAVDSAFLGPAVSELKNENVQKEFYLTDIVERAYQEGQTIETLVTFDDSEIQGVNTRADLARVNRALMRSKCEALLSDGVTVLDPDSLFIDESVTVAPGTVIGPCVTLLGDTIIEADVVIEGSAYISNARIGTGCSLRHSVRIESATVGSESIIGPFAHLRPETVLGNKVRVGNFVETKKATFADGAKASHLSYIGDAEIGTDVNIGAGTITANYDGYNKFKTSIQADASIGSNTVLVAPVTVGHGAYVGAGSVITKDIEPDALALTRAPLKMKSGWNKARREAKKKK